MAVFAKISLMHLREKGEEGLKARLGRGMVWGPPSWVRNTSNELSNLLTGNIVLLSVVCNK